jgi:hypothetical protein
MTCPFCRTRPTNGAETCGHPTCVGAAISRARPSVQARAAAQAIRHTSIAQAVALVERRRAVS